MFRLLLLTFVTGLAANAGAAQTPPSVGKVSHYNGLFAAAYTGNEEIIRRLVAAGANVNARDSRGRTPALVAAFASEDEALRAPAEVGVDMNALEGQEQDVVSLFGFSASASNQAAQLRTRLLQSRNNEIREPTYGP